MLVRPDPSAAITSICEPLTKAMLPLRLGEPFPGSIVVGMPDLGGVATRVCVGVGIGNPKELALRGGDVDRGRRISAGGDAGEWRFVDSFPSTGGGPARELRFSSAKTSDSSIKSVSVLNTIRATPLSAASVTPAALIQTNLRNHDCRSGSQVSDSSRVAT